MISTIRQSRATIAATMRRPPQVYHALCCQPSRVIPAISIVAVVALDARQGEGETRRRFEVRGRAVQNGRPVANVRENVLSVSGIGSRRLVKLLA